MMSGKSFLLGLVAATSLAFPAMAQQAAATVKVTAGSSVVDTSGNAVGTIEQVNGDLAILSTGASKVSLPLNSFGASDKGLVLGMTKAEVDAAAAGASANSQAEVAAQVAPGATVSDTSGGTVGKVEAVEGEFATVATAKSKVKLPITAFAKGATGPVIAMTADQLDAAASSAAGKTGSN